MSFTGKALEALIKIHPEIFSRGLVQHLFLRNIFRLLPIHTILVNSPKKNRNIGICRFVIEWIKGGS